MAYTIIGQVHDISKPEQIPTRTGSTIQKRTLTLMQRRFDQNTGEEYTPNYPQLEFSGNVCEHLNAYKKGDRVSVRFEVQGVTYADKNTGEVKYLTRLRGFRIETYTPQQHNAPAPQPSQSPFPPSNAKQPLEIF